MIELKPGDEWPFTIGSISDDNRAITCEPLMEHPHQGGIKKGDELMVVYSAEDGVYRFPMKVAKIEDDPANLMLTLASDATHIQRREFFRLNRPFVKAKYHPIGDAEDIFGSELIEAPVKDLSGNGIAFIISKAAELPSGTPVITEIELADGQRVSIAGEVIRCIPNEPIVDKSLLCIHFSLIEERDRDRIIGNLFREQLDRAGRRRRLHRRS